MALALALNAVVGHAAAAPRGGYEGLLAAAEELEAAGRREAALQAYAGAFDSMPGELRVSGVGEFVALEAGRVAMEDFEARGEREALELGRTLLQDFIRGVEAGGVQASDVSLDAARQRLAQLEAMMTEDWLSVVEPEGTAELEPAEPEAEPDAPRRDDGPAPLAAMGKAGVALLVVGGVGVGVGVGLAAAQPKYGPRGDLQATQITTTRPPGWATLGAGLATVVVGAVLLGIDRRRARSDETGHARRQDPRGVWVSVQPWWHGAAGGLMAQGRF